MAQTLYNFSSITQEFLKTSEAMLDLLETEKQGIDVYLIPANATNISVPTTGTNQVAVFDTNISTWSVQNDFRGNWYNPANGALEQVDDIGVSPTPGFIDTPPPGAGYEWDGAQWVRTLALAKIEKTGEMAQEFFNATSVSISSNGSDWSIDQTSLRQNIALYWMKKTFNSGDYDLIDSLGTFVNVGSGNTAKDIVKDIIDAYKPLLANSIAKKVEIAIAADVATVDSITWV